MAWKQTRLLHVGRGWEKTIVTKSGSSLLNDSSEMAKSHPSLIVTKTTDALGPLEMKRRVERFYDWAKEEWYYRWTSRYLLLVIVYTLYVIRNRHLQLKSLNNKNNYEIASENHFTLTEKESKDNRSKVTELLTLFSTTIPKPTSDQISDLKKKIELIMNPRQISASQAWEDICDKKRQRDLKELEAYRRSNQLEAIQRGTSQIVSQKSDGSVNINILNTSTPSYGLIQPEIPAELAKRIEDEKMKAKESQENINWITELANSGKK